jgi:mono/diheme cytochrome c family protein
MKDLSSARLSHFPATVRIVISYTIVLLGIGYLIALFNLYLAYSLTDGQPGLTVGDLKRAFYGNRDNTRLAAKIHGGSMEQFLPKPGDKEKILSWIQDGAVEGEYQVAVKSILMQNCVRCHSPGGLQHFRPLTNYEEVMTVVQIDRGEPVGLWARVAHTHIQSIALIFLVLGLVFSFTSIAEKLKYLVISLPFVALVADFGTRFLAKYYPSLVYMMVLSGAIIGFSFAIMILLPLYEMWIKKRE